MHYNGTVNLAVNSAKGRTEYVGDVQEERGWIELSGRVYIRLPGYALKPSNAQYFWLTILILPLLGQRNLTQIRLVLLQRSNHLQNNSFSNMILYVLFAHTTS